MPPALNFRLWTLNSFALAFCVGTLFAALIPCATSTALQSDCSGSNAQSTTRQDDIAHSVVVSNEDNSPPGSDQQQEAARPHHPELDRLRAQRDAASGSTDPRPEREPGESANAPPVGAQQIGGEDPPGGGGEQDACEGYTFRIRSVVGTGPDSVQIEYELGHDVPSPGCEFPAYYVVGRRPDPGQGGSGYHVDAQYLSGLTCGIHTIDVDLQCVAGEFTITIVPEHPDCNTVFGDSFTFFKGSVTFDPNDPWIPLVDQHPGLGDLVDTAINCSECGCPASLEGDEQGDTAVTAPRADRLGSNLEFNSGTGDGAAGCGECATGAPGDNLPFLPLGFWLNNHMSAFQSAAGAGGSTPFDGSLHAAADPATGDMLVRMVDIGSARIVNFQPSAGGANARRASNESRRAADESRRAAGVSPLFPPSAPPFVTPAAPANEPRDPAEPRSGIRKNSDLQLRISASASPLPQTHQRSPSAVGGEGQGEGESKSSSRLQPPARDPAEFLPPIEPDVASPVSAQSVSFSDGFDHYRQGELIGGATLATATHFEVTRHNGEVLRFELFDLSGDMDPSLDREGRLVSWKNSADVGYDIEYSDGDSYRINRITDPRGRVYTFSYGGKQAGHDAISSIAMPNGATATFTYSDHVLASVSVSNGGAPAWQWTNGKAAEGDLTKMTVNSPQFGERVYRYHDDYLWSLPDQMRIPVSVLDTIYDAGDVNRILRVAPAFGLSAQANLYYGTPANGDMELVYHENDSAHPVSHWLYDPDQLSPPADSSSMYSNGPKNEWDPPIGEASIPPAQRVIPAQPPPVIPAQSLPPRRRGAGTQAQRVIPFQRSHLTLGGEGRGEGESHSVSDGSTSRSRSRSTSTSEQILSPSLLPPSAAPQPPLPKPFSVHT